jgi:hypothetical protein
LKSPIPDPLLQELSFGSTASSRRVGTAKRRSRAPSSFDELKKAYGYLLGNIERIVVPEHHNYQVRLSTFLAGKGIDADMEADFVDVSFSLEGSNYIGEIKVTRNLTIVQAFRAALGQLLDYAHTRGATPPQMIMFLDRPPDKIRLELASLLSISVVHGEGERFVLLNPGRSNSQLAALFP